MGFAFADIIGCLVCKLKRVRHRQTLEPLIVNLPPVQQHRGLEGS